MANNKETSFEIIRHRLFGENGDLIQLTDKQQQLLERWNYVIELKCCDRLSNNHIVAQLMMKFAVERATAFNDIGYAEALFGYSTPINKRFRIGARINYLEERIYWLNENGYHKESAMQEANLRRLYIQYPEFNVQQRPRSFEFKYNGNKPLEENIPTVEDAEFILLQALKDAG